MSDTYFSLERSAHSDVPFRCIAETRFLSDYHQRYRSNQALPPNWYWAPEASHQHSPPYLWPNSSNYHLIWTTHWFWSSCWLVWVAFPSWQEYWSSCWGSRFTPAPSWRGILRVRWIWSRSWSLVWVYFSSRSLTLDFRLGLAKTTRNRWWYPTSADSSKWSSPTASSILICSGRGRCPFPPSQATEFWRGLTRWVGCLWLIVQRGIGRPCGSFSWPPGCRSTGPTRLPFRRRPSSAGCVARSPSARCDQSTHRGVIFCRRWSRRCFRVWCWYVRGIECAGAFPGASWRSLRMPAGRLPGWWMSIIWGSAVCCCWPTSLSTRWGSPGALSTLRSPRSAHCCSVPFWINYDNGIISNTSH